MLQRHIIPYKRLSECGLEELAAEQRAKERYRQSGGVQFARKEIQEEKTAARRQILNLLKGDMFPGCISILTMPGLQWKFERKLLWEREPYWGKSKRVKRVRFTCVENDRLIYYSATTQIPRANDYHCVRTLEKPPYAECAVGSSIIDRFIFGNVYDLIDDSRENFDVAWLDFTGPVTFNRMKILERFWLEQVGRLLVVTALKGRWDKPTSNAVVQHGSYLDWMRTCLPGNELHAIEYQDGHSPMVQFAVSK